MIRGAVAVAAVVLLSGCAASHHPPMVASTAPPTSTTVHASQWPAPDNGLTPGAVVAGCTYPAPKQRNVTSVTRAKVLAEYHYSGPTDLAHIELDHRVPHSLCGADTASNLWVEPYDGVNVSEYIHNYKDELELAIASKVRAGRMTLQQGQAVFLADWRVGYCTYIGGSACPGS